MLLKYLEAVAKQPRSRREALVKKSAEAFVKVHKTAHEAYHKIACSTRVAIASSDFRRSPLSVIDMFDKFVCGLAEFCW